MDAGQRIRGGPFLRGWLHVLLCGFFHFIALYRFFWSSAHIMLVCNSTTFDSAFLAPLRSQAATMIL